MKRAKNDAPRFERETDLCAAFIAAVAQEREGDWVPFAETAGFDILLASKKTGVQIGIEAKLALNTKVLTQALPFVSTYVTAEVGPDYRAVLIPDYAADGGLRDLFAALGITILRQSVPDERGRFPRTWFSLPNSRMIQSGWHPWCPVRRCKLPDYIPDVQAGASAPVALTAWKVSAIKLAILLEDGPVTRADFRALGMSPSRWTDPWTGWLKATPEGYVRGPHMPDFAAQHPRNYGEIKADRAKWIWPRVVVSGKLLSGVKV